MTINREHLLVAAIEETGCLNQDRQLDWTAGKWEPLSTVPHCVQVTFCKFVLQALHLTEFILEIVTDFGRDLANAMVSSRLNIQKQRLCSCMILDGGTSCYAVLNSNHLYIIYMYKCFMYHYWIIEGSLEVKLPIIWTDEKAEVGRVREEKRRRKKIREEKESEERRCRCAKR